ncbi:CHY zinc finger protein [Streptococcus saliviloxodontae]|uniref:CHY zinc finger protein n=1 Tax=Streptococcus saliviloxodontae TaxID=1349416 RepID=UPI0019620558|nr:CHY zinc finger protein [Streptococcus saliviloxodontae]
MIYGLDLDRESRCRHYHSQLDIVALKCFLCQRYYACYKCHNACQNHSFAPYPLSRREDLVVICGVCHKEMTIADYKEVSACVACQSPFNPRCHLHEAIYFKS